MLKNVHIRAMQSFDLGAVMATEHAAYTTPWSERMMADCLASNYRCEVAFSGSTLLAHMVSQQVLDELHLLNLCVSPTHQRRGVGLALLQHLIDDGLRLGAAQLFLEVRRSNRAAIKLYSSLGFSLLAERKGYYRDPKGREDALVMSRALCPGA